MESAAATHLARAPWNSCGSTFSLYRACLFSIFIRIDIAQLFRPALHIHPLSYLARRGGRVAEGARLEDAAVGVCLSFHLENRRTDGLAQSPQVGGWCRPPEFPCIFPGHQGSSWRDEFATDCLHRHLVGRRRDSASGARVGPPKPRDCAGFWARALVDPNRRPRVPGLEDAGFGVCLCCQVGRFGFARDSPAESS